MYLKSLQLFESIILLCLALCVGAEASDQNEERGVYALLSVTVCVPVWHFLVHLRSNWSWPICGCKLHTTQILITFLEKPFLWWWRLVTGQTLFCYVLQVPNGVGSLLGATQLILYFIYRHSKSDPKKETATEEEEGTVEMPNQNQTNSNRTTPQEERV